MEEVISTLITKKKTCPHCDNSDFIEKQIYENMINYVRDKGGEDFHLPCMYCNKIIHICLIRKVEICQVKKSNKSSNNNDVSFLKLFNKKEN